MQKHCKQSAIDAMGAGSVKTQSGVSASAVQTEKTGEIELKLQGSVLTRYDVIFRVGGLRYLGLRLGLMIADEHAG